ncbi:MAG: outer membrane protein transport protein [Rhodoferax sp.]|nr:outer membrane protein transport protein [Rhodoferax sp.]
MDVSYTDWAKWDAFQFKFDQEVEMLKMARMFGISNSAQVIVSQGLENVFSYGFGVQYDVSDKLSLRLGYEPRKSSIPLSKISVLAPLPDTVVKASVQNKTQERHGNKLGAVLRDRKL